MATFNAGSIEATLDLDVDPFQRGIALARGEGRKFAGETFTATLDVDTIQANRGIVRTRRELERVAGRTYSANFEVRGLAEAATEAAGLKAALGGLSGDRQIDVGLDSRSANAGIGGIQRGLRGIIPLLAIVSTGLVPLTAAAVPVLGLLNNLTLAAGAGGAAVLAFQGVGGALKAANAAGIEPSAANLEKMHAAMSKLTPEARAFVTELRDMRGEASALQQTAAAEFFPGLTSGLRSVDLNDYRGLVRELASVGGDQLGSTLKALDDPRWVQFFTFLEAEARPGVEDLGRSVGNLAGFFASLWQAFDPLNDDFSAWMVDATARARDWADSLEGSEDFEDFVAYVREQGPEAAQALGALGGALVDIVEAAAPLGGVVLDGLEALGNAVSFIADQPFGDEILLGAAALYTFNKALGITQGLMGRMGMGAVAGTAAAAGTGPAGFFSGVGSRAEAAGGRVRGFASDLGTVALASRATDRGLTASNEAAERLRGTLGRFAGGAAAIGSVAMMATGADEALGLTNTTMLTLAGSMAGPWGAAAGATVGMFLDLRAAANRGTEALEAFQNMTANTSSLAVYTDAARQLRTEVDGITSSRTGQAGIGLEAASHVLPGWAGDVAGGMSDVFGGDNTNAAVSGAATAERDAAALADAARGLAAAQGMAAGTTADLDAALLSAQPALNALGYSTRDLIDAANTPGGVAKLLADVEGYQSAADSAKGRTQAFASSVADLANDALATADSATAMSQALEALLSPALNLEAATDAWRVSLRALESDLKAGVGFKGYGEAVEANRTATRDYVTTSMERLTALAGVSTTTEKDMAQAVAATRREFIDSGIAAGISRKAIVARANALGLTPKMVRTVFEAAGIDEVDLRARKLRSTYRSLPKGVQTRLRADGIPETMAEVDRLVEKYELSEKDRQALVTLKNLADKPLGDVLEKLGLVDAKHATPSVSLDGGSSVLGALGNIFGWMDNLDGKVATTTVRTVREGGMGPQLATGGPVYGPGTGTSDSIPAWLSNGEHVWTAAEVARAGGHAAVEAIRAQFRYAAGGGVDMGRRTHVGLSRAVVAPLAAGRSHDDVGRIVEAIRANRGVYVNVRSREDLETAFRALESELRKV